MPELPEVETTRRGIEPHVTGRMVTAVAVRDHRLRWPIEQGLSERLRGQRVRAVERRAKYLLLRLELGTLMIHLGMSGSLRILPAAQPPALHEHVDVLFDNGAILRYADPRRFGSFHWLPGEVPSHVLLASLGPEPLEAGLTAEFLYRRSRGRRIAVKTFIMDSRTVVGVGNIYASEALFRAGILPSRAAGRVSLRRYALLVDAIRHVLAQAIAAGGTTLRDFVGSSGQPGYFSQELQVYGREGEPCRVCGAPVRQQRMAQRATYFCSHCQR
ncbi:formamidopyrimidine-DNA glycosylase [Natronocella acetinitrilica]|uniref:Formamidopyrimidine-DNA glycosylase n=1 Tax=Natronocella acetinitrilica TaxID=414046 RepID=A0AAE3G1T1_9GAMM|nr:bifunctional DNA-formamidopyrimidine glycosylase/DNA-(apurinic or apyrimidinic site) lyase [Natronocella acetinitrilica]MCP1673151.1 formamidopyrimidine-DNA glycosylase [Natronocella acetinitrilica]